MLKNFWILSAIAYSVVLTTVSLMTLRNLPNVGVSFGDKIFHFLAYFVLAFLWAFAFFYNYNFKKTRALQLAFVFSVVFGIIIEVLQGTLTVARSFDVYDMLANSFGSLLAIGVLAFCNLKHIKKL